MRLDGEFRGVDATLRLELEECAVRTRSREVRRETDVGPADGSARGMHVQVLDGALVEHDEMAEVAEVSLEVPDRSSFPRDPEADRRVVTGHQHSRVQFDGIPVDLGRGGWFRERDAGGHSGCRQIDPEDVALPAGGEVRECPI